MHPANLEAYLDVTMDVAYVKTVYVTVLITAETAVMSKDVQVASCE